MSEQPSERTVEDGHVIAKDGVRLALRWDTVAEPIGTVLVAHGYGEYLRRHQHLADALVAARFDVLRYDMRGHGHSGGRRGHVDRFGDYLDDLDQLIGLARQRRDGPLFLVAHSQGGLIAVHALMQGRLDLSGVVLTNPALHTKTHVPEWKKIAARLLSRAMPHFSLPTEIPPEYVSRDPASVADYRDDPLIFDLATARWGWEFMTAQEQAKAATLQVDLPLLVQLGSGDPLIDPDVGERCLSRTRGDDVTLTVWPGYYHELFNEPEEERAKVLAELTGWLTQRAH